MKMPIGPPICVLGSRRLVTYITVILSMFALVLAACGMEPAPAPDPTPIASPAIEPVAVQPAAPTETNVPAPTATSPPVVQPTEEPLPTVDPDYEAKIVLIEALWEESPHGNTYDFGKGPNTYCSRCHSPQNWDPASKPGTPPNCITCKFPMDEELRIANTMDFVSEEDWMGIGCETCHPVVDGVVQAELAWLNPITMEHEPINTSNELCQKCHVTTQGVRASGGRGVTHGITLGGSAHANWAGALPQERRPQYCSDCHDPHSTEPVQCVDCHEGILTLETHIKGKGALHTNVTCLACHDADGMLSGPHPASDNGEWVTLVSSVSRTGETVTAYQKSHSIQWQVDCTRCHFANNPWELVELSSSGEPVEPAED